jgi:hypothetical protein
VDIVVRSSYLVMAGGRLYLRVHGTAGLSRAATRFTEQGYALFLKGLGQGAKDIEQGVKSRYLTVNATPDNRGSEGISSRVNAKGAAVFQTLRKTEFPSNRRPNYGPRMLAKAFIPAMREDRARVVANAKAALEEAKKLYWHD